MSDLIDKRIAKLEAALARSCEDARNDMYDCGYNALKADNERLHNQLISMDVGHNMLRDEIKRLREALAAAPPMTENSTPCLKEYRRWYKQYCEALEK